MNSFAMRDRPARLADEDADAESGEGILAGKNVTFVNCDNEQRKDIVVVEASNDEDGKSKGKIAVTRQWSIIVDNGAMHR